MMYTLKRVQEPDLIPMLSWAASPLEAFQWSGGSLTFPLDMDQLRRYALDPPSNRIPLGFADEDGDMVGYLELINIDKNNDSCTVSRVAVAPNKRAHGIGQRIMSCAIRKAFEELHLNRISLHVFDFNVPAIRCYERAGFKKEGLLRQVYKNDNKYWDVYLMTVLRDEFYPTTQQQRGELKDALSQP